MQWVNIFHIYQPPNWDQKIIHQVVREAYAPLVSHLKENPNLHITLNITGALTEQLAQYGYTALLHDIRDLVLAEQIELLASAAYHPFLPNLSESEIHRQIELNNNIQKKVFGSAWSPKGFYPPEMAINEKVFHVVASRGFNYILADEIAYNGHFNQVDYHKNYTLPDGLKVLFRNREASDAFLENSSPTSQQFVRYLEKEFHEEGILITALDGENLGHHRKNMDRIWLHYALQPRIETVTAASFLSQRTESQTISPLPSSWSSRADEMQLYQPFNLWHDPTNPIHEAQWKLLETVFSIVHEHHHPEARILLDRAMVSDQFWWASAKPWWCFEIVRDLTQQLRAVCDPLTLSPHTRADLDQQTNAIIALAEEWNTSGVAQKRRQAYLSHTENAYFMAGERIQA